MAFNIFKTETILGIGIGFILSAVIVGFYPADKPITNKEIIEQARELGMITQQEHEAKLQKKLQEEKGLEQSDGEEINDAKDESMVQADSVNAGQGEGQRADTRQEPALPKTVKVHVPKGSDSDSIARILIKAGVKTDLETFRKAANEMDAPKRFQAGDFIVPVEGDIKKAIEILTHRPNV